MKKISIQVLLSIVLLSGIYGFTSYSLSSHKSKNTQNIAPASFKTTSEDAPVVYFTSDISSGGLIKIYKALGREATGKVGVKLHSGEPGGNYYLHPELIKDLVQSVNGTIVECNTAYGGGRASTALHKQVMIDHGFTAIAPTDIMDEEGYTAIPVKNGKHLTQDFVGSHFENYDFYIILSHFKGHQMGGFGGAVKNMSIGIASSRGKSWIHSAGTSTTGFGGDHNNFLESMAEAASAVADKIGDSIIYISVMNNLSVDCDCNAHPSTPTMKDIGILASLDPVALDQACVDMVYAAPDGQNLIRRMESLDGIHTLEHAIEIGFGSREYNMVNIDSTSSVNDIKAKTINVYPNPATSYINIPNCEEFDEINVFNVNGQQILNSRSENKIETDNLKPGRYYIQFKANGQLKGASSFLKK